MNIKDVIISQYLASLEMLSNAVKACPDRIWADSKHKNKFWHIAYHAIFYTHLYLQNSEDDFIPWEKHRDEYQFMGSLPEAPSKKPAIDTPYLKGEIIEYLEFCKKQVIETLPILNLDSDASGFYWLPFGKLELQFYNIRHLQQHTGELYERLGTEENIDVQWVGKGSV
jgi:hypothetical protein